MWYQHEGQGDFVIITTCSEFTNYDTTLRVFKGGCDDLRCYIGNDDFLCPHDHDHATVAFIAFEGETYYILVGLSWLGIVRDLRPVPRRVVEAGR